MFSIIINLLSPLFSILYNSIIFFKYKNLNSRVYLSICFSIIFCLSLINANRIIEGDLFNYYVSYLYILENGLSGVFNQSTPEYLFYLLMYFFTFLGEKGFNLFLFSCSFLIYLLPLLAWQKKFFSYHDKNIIFSIILIFLLFPMIFNLSTQILRQFLSFSIIYFGLTKYNTSPKSLIFIFISIFIHASSLIFLAIYAFSYFLNSKKKNRIWVFFYC